MVRSGPAALERGEASQGGQGGAPPDAQSLEHQQHRQAFQAGPVETGLGRIGSSNASRSGAPLTIALRR